MHEDGTPSSRMYAEWNVHKFPTINISSARYTELFIIPRYRHTFSGHVDYFLDPSDSSISLHLINISETNDVTVRY